MIHAGAGTSNSGSPLCPEVAGNDDSRPVSKSTSAAASPSSVSPLGVLPIGGKNSTPFIERRAQPLLVAKAKGKQEVKTMTTIYVDKNGQVTYERHGEDANAIAKLTPEDIEALAVEAADKAKRRAR
jgi:hypothetical protein